MPRQYEVLMFLQSTLVFLPQSTNQLNKQMWAINYDLKEVIFHDLLKIISWRRQRSFYSASDGMMSQW